MQKNFSLASIVSLQMKTNYLAAFCILTFVSVCIYVVWWFWRLNRAYAKFPSKRFEVEVMTKLLLGKFPKNVPFTSVMFEKFTKTAQLFKKEGFFVLWFFQPFMFIYGKDIMKRLYAEPALANKSSMYDFLRFAMGNGLVISDGDLWKKHRKLLNPAFHVGELKGKMCIFNDVAAQMVTELEKVVDHPTLHFIEIIKNGSFDVMAQGVLGLKLDDENYREKLLKFFDAVHQLTESMTYRMAHPWLYWDIALPLFTKGRNYIRQRAFVRHFIQEILSQMKNALVAVTESGKDLNEFDVLSKKSFTRILLQEHLKDPTFTIEDVQDQIATITGAGFDTSSQTLQWCFYMLGLHPDVQEKAFKELEKLSGQHVTYDDLYELKYLECIIKECLRLYSTIPIYARQLNKDIQWEGYTIPRGTHMIFFISELHKDPDLYPDPETFDPERFLGNTEVSPWTFMPFSEGYRNCIGKKFAMMEMKVILAHIIRRFKLETMEKINVSDVKWIITLAPVKPVSMLFTLR